jgi:hypothetical protein
MGSTREILATGTGCDAIIFCAGEMYMVHKAIVGVESPFLKQEMSTSKVSEPFSQTCCITDQAQFLGGEAYILNDVTPSLFRRVLSFIYRKPVSEYPELRRYALTTPVNISHTELHERFPLTESFLSTLNPSAEPKTECPITNGEKWSALTAQQSNLRTPFEDTGCGTYYDFLVEVETYLVADRLQISKLKELTSKKVLEWFEGQLTSKAPPSESILLAASGVFEKGGQLARQLDTLCAAYYPLVTQHPALVSLLNKSNTTTWSCLSAVYPQWRKTFTQIQTKLLSSEKDVAGLRTKVAELEHKCQIAEKHALTLEEKLAEKETVNKVDHEQPTSKIVSLGGTPVPAFLNLGSQNHVQLQHPCLAQETSLPRNTRIGTYGSDTLDLRPGMQERDPDLVNKVTHLQQMLVQKDEALEMSMLNSKLSREELTAKSRTYLQLIQEVEKLRYENVTLSTEIADRDNTLRSSQASGRRHKNELKHKIIDLEKQLEKSIQQKQSGTSQDLSQKMQQMWTLFKEGVNQPGQCGSCHIPWNLTITRHNMVAGVNCKNCRSMTWYNLR